jgi:hypothetical protein
VSTTLPGSSAGVMLPRRLRVLGCGVALACRERRTSFQVLAPPERTHDADHFAPNAKHRPEPQGTAGHRLRALAGHHFERVPPIVGKLAVVLSRWAARLTRPEEPDSLLTSHFHGPPSPETLLPRWAYQRRLRKTPEGSPWTTTTCWVVIVRRSQAAQTPVRQSSTG